MDYKKNFYEKMFKEAETKYFQNWRVSRYGHWIADAAKDAARVYVTSAASASKDGYNAQYSYNDLFFEEILDGKVSNETWVEITKPFEVSRDIADVDMDAFERIVCGG